MNERYQRERHQVELALHMILREARTNTIRRCTGLSDDRIRKLCVRYFASRDGQGIRRRRGKSPQQVARFVKNAAHQLESTTLMHLFIVFGLIEQQPDGLRCPWPSPDVDYGARFCAAFETYRAVHRDALYSFEWAWALLEALSRDDELAVGQCSRCDSDYLRDRYGLDYHVCPACEIRTERRRRPGARQYADS